MRTMTSMGMTATPMARNFAVQASEEIALEAAEQALSGGASPLQAGLSAFFAAAGSAPSVLLGPLVILLSGYGANRAFDGRVRQPGIGTKRPRGFLENEPIPDAARVGIPASIAAGFVALAYDRSHSLAFPTRYGIGVAKRLDALRRAGLLTTISRLGAGAFRERQLSKPLIHVAGPSERGVVTAEDFEQTPNVDLACRLEVIDGVKRVCAPWDPDGGDWETVRAIDATGTAVSLAYQHPERGVAVPEWELSAPLCAVPVMRGVPRTSPGTPCGGAPALEIQLGPDGVATEVCAPDGSVLRRPR